jgi:hypothetical protein
MATFHGRCEVVLDTLRLRHELKARPLQNALCGARGRQYVARACGGASGVTVSAQGDAAGV